MKIWVIAAMTLGLAINDVFEGDFLKNPMKEIAVLIVTFVILYLLNNIYLKFSRRKQ